MFTIALLIGTAIISLVLTVVALIFGVIAFANSKPSKFIWLTTFLIGLTSIIICVILAVTKTVNAVENFTENTIGQFENMTDSLSSFESVDQHQANSSSAQIQLLKSYLDPTVLNNEPEEFYSYLGFKDYYRYPLRYPYSVHCIYDQTTGELYNEINVTRFDENDNGEIYSGIEQINKIAFDKNHLLIEQEITSSRTDKLKYRYVLFNFNSEKKEEYSTLQKLLESAKEKGYNGPDTLMSLKQYYLLF
jgi:hypothetical protein